MMPRTRLFSPISMRSLEFANRIVVSPMGQYSADENGLATLWHTMHLGNLAISGAGLVFVEATAVEPCGRVSGHCLGIWSDEQVTALAQSVSFCRRHGAAKLGIQLAHSGRKGSVTVPWERQRALASDEGGWSIASASELAYPGRAIPRALDADGLKRVREAFAAAARRAAEVEFDLIELHCAHGYLLNSFLSPLANARADAYGGSLENRMRYPLEVFEAVRAAWPERRPMGVRISATDWTDGGWSVEDSVAFAKALKARGCDYVCASSGGVSATQKIPLTAGYQVPFADRIRSGADIPTMAVGLITQPQQAEEILLAGQADFIALGRGMLYNPRWPWHAAEHFGEEVYFPPQYERAHPSMRRADFSIPFREKPAAG